jgi:hypothetical protein
VTRPAAVTRAAAPQARPPARTAIVPPRGATQAAPAATVPTADVTPDAPRDVHPGVALAVLLLACIAVRRTVRG